MTTAGMASFDSLPDNCWVADYAPGSALMEHADAVVCQGGNGTIYQALSHGVPIVGIPTMHDQEFNLDRVAALGAGIHLSELRFRPEQLLAAVDEVVSEPGYRAAADHQRDVLRTYHGPTRAADAVEELLAAA